MRLYRDRASEFELLAESEPLSEVGLRYRAVIIASWRTVTSASTKQKWLSTSNS
jgi:hypothetical protein